MSEKRAVRKVAGGIPTGGGAGGASTKKKKFSRLELAKAAGVDLSDTPGARERMAEFVAFMRRNKLGSNSTPSEVRQAKAIEDAAADDFFNDPNIAAQQDTADVGTKQDDFVQPEAEATTTTDEPEVKTQEPEAEITPEPEAASGPEGNIDDLSVEEKKQIFIEWKQSGGKLKGASDLEKAINKEITTFGKGKGKELKDAILSTHTMSGVEKKVSAKSSPRQKAAAEASTDTDEPTLDDLASEGGNEDLDGMDSTPDQAEAVEVTPKRKRRRRKKKQPREDATLEELADEEQDFSQSKASQDAFVSGQSSGVDADDPNDMLEAAKAKYRTKFPMPDDPEDTIKWTQGYREFVDRMEKGLGLTDDVPELRPKRTFFEPGQTGAAELADEGFVADPMFGKNPLSRDGLAGDIARGAGAQLGKGARWSAGLALPALVGHYGLRAVSPGYAEMMDNWWSGGKEDEDADSLFSKGAEGWMQMQRDGGFSLPTPPGQQPVSPDIQSNPVDTIRNQRNNPGSQQ